MASSFEILFITVLFGVTHGPLSARARGKDLSCHVVNSVCTLYLAPSSGPKDKDYRPTDPWKVGKKKAQQANNAMYEAHV